MQLLTYRLSIFGDFKRFTPTAENTITWTKAFQDAGYELIPSIIDSPQSVIPSPFFTIPQGVSEKRMQFSNTMGNIVVRFLSERIDIEFIGGHSNQVNKYFTETLPKACDLFSVALNILDSIEGTRLAYFTDILIDEDKPNHFAPLYSNNVDITLNNYEGEYVEWGHRFNKRVTLDIENNPETCNTILQLEAGALQTIVPPAGIPHTIKGLHVLTDINTLAESEIERFNVDSAVEFFNKAQTIFLDMLNQIITKVI